MFKHSPEQIKEFALELAAEILAGNSGYSAS